MIITEEMKKEEITRLDLLPLSFLKESPYTGSKRGVRFRLERANIGGGEAGANSYDKKDFATGERNDRKVSKTVLRCYVWHGKMAFKNTPAKEIRVKDVDFSDAGIDEAIKYLNEEALK